MVDLVVVGEGQILSTGSAECLTCQNSFGMIRPLGRCLTYIESKTWCRKAPEGS